MNKTKIKFFLTKNKEQIRYKLISGNKPVTIIFLHGFMSDLTGKKIKSLGKISAKENVSFFTFEYTGHGKSSGMISNYGIEDWINQSKEIIEKIEKTKNIILIGSSMGAWIASCLIGKMKKKIKGFVGIAAAPDFTKDIMWKNFSKKIKSTISNGNIYYLPNSYNSFYPISKKLIDSGKSNLILTKKIICDFPVRLFHGLKDETVPASFAIRLSKTLQSKDTIIFFQKNGDHSLSERNDLKKIQKELIELIQNTF